MLFYNEQKQKFNKAIKDQNMKLALSTIIDGYKTSMKQDMKMFELVDTNDIFSVMDNLIKEGKEIPNKYLALTSIYWNSNYVWDIGHGTAHNSNQSKYIYLGTVYEKKVKEPEYCQVLLKEWKRLFKDMIKQSTVYRSEKNISKFYYTPHDYEELVIERSAYSLCKIMFSQAKKDEIIEIILNCKKYPKIPYANKEIDRRYNRQNSRYYDVQYFSAWLSENALPLTRINNNQEQTYIEIPIVSQGLLNEIKLFYEEINSNKKLLEPENKLLFEKLYTQRLPELLNHYQNIDKKYNMTNRNNQNADELLYNSLLEVRTIFERFNNELDIKKIEKFSLNIKITKEFIKHTF